MEAMDELKALLERREELRGRIRAMKEELGTRERLQRSSGGHEGGGQDAVAEAVGSEVQAASVTAAGNTEEEKKEEEAREGVGADEARTAPKGEGQAEIQENGQGKKGGEKNVGEGGDGKKDEKEAGVQGEKEVPGEDLASVEEDLMGKIRMAQSLQFELINKTQIETMLIHRIQQNRVLLEALFSDVSSNESTSPSALFLEKIKTLCRCRDDKVREYFELLKEYEIVQKELTEQETQTAALNKKNQRLFQKIESFANEATPTPSDEYQQLKKRVDALTTVTKALILQSDVNWAEDKALRDIVLAS